MRDEMKLLSEQIANKVSQLENYRELCSIFHAQMIVEGRLQQCRQIQHWIDVLDADLLDTGEKKDVENG